MTLRHMWKRCNPKVELEQKLKSYQSSTREIYLYLRPLAWAEHVVRIQGRLRISYKFSELSFLIPYLIFIHQLNMGIINCSKAHF